ncbi:ig-like domain-containing protein [Nephila pilipes]|uniref:Ig-like domain-containing protein n=2 Tax=Nephila pilipes TaxID=299642 RepID=A0A8X6TM31_NEPPI|nr:ig-like domain-containing protein [Nephila pilipes]
MIKISPFDIGFCMISRLHRLVITTEAMVTHSLRSMSESIDAPVCRNGLLKTYSVPVDEMERIECQVDADPSKVDFKWSFSNTADRHYNVSFTSAGLRSVATYTPRSARDYGTLYCWGKNSVGEQQMPCIFTIIPLGPPETLQNCTSTNVTMYSITITCVRGTRQDSDLKYNLEMFMFLSTEMMYYTSSPRPNFEITNLNPGTDYLFAVYAVNHNGKSSPVIVRVKTLNSPPTEGRVIGEQNSSNETSSDHSWIGPSLLIAVALCCFLIFTGAAIWSKLRGGPGCQKCKEIPKQFHMKKNFSKRIKNNKNYIDRLMKDSHNMRK